MQKITKIYEVYSFNELSEGAQEKALEQLYDINVDYEWYEPLIEGAAEDLDIKGYKEADIKFTGFSSQGDGASFSCWVDVDNWLKANKLITKYKKLYGADLSVSIGTSGRYSHEYTMDIQYDNSIGNEADAKLLDELADCILAAARDEARRIYKLLNKQYDYLTSREAIIETIEANEYKFLKNGKMFSENQ